MQLITAWKESLSLFKPASLQLFCLVTANSILQTYKVWLLYWGWLIGCLLGFGIFYAPFLLDQGLSIILWGPTDILYVPKQFFVPSLLFSLLLLVLYSTLYLSARPSLLQKNYSYFFGYGKHIFFILVWFFLLMVIQPMISGQSLFMHVLLAMVGTAIMSFFSSFFMLFLLDSDATLMSLLNSLKRAGMMVLYNLPFCFVMGIFYTIILFMLAYLLVVMGIFVAYLNFLLFICFFLAFVCKYKH